MTAILEGVPLYSVYLFSRNDGQTNYVFNTSGQLTSMSDANNYAETFAYGVTTGTNCTTSGTACDTETDAEGRVLDIVYSTSTGLVSKVIDPAGRTWSFAYDGSDNLTSITNPAAGSSPRLRHRLGQSDHGPQHDYPDRTQRSVRGPRRR